MTRINGEILIRAPVAEVFDFVADQRNEVTYNPHMVRSEKVTAGPVGEGTRFHAAVAARGRTAEMDIEYTEYQRPVRLSSTTRMAQAEFSGTLTFEPTGAGTRMRWSWEARFRGPLRLLAPVLARFGGRQEQATWAGLKRRLEPAQAASGDGGEPPGLGWAGAALLSASAAGVLLVPLALRHLGPRGGLLVGAGCGVLFARDAGLALAGAPARLRPLPRLLLLTEVALSGTAAGAGMLAWGCEHRAATRVAMVTAATTLMLHTTRFAIYLSPGHGLREQPVQ